MDGLLLAAAVALSILSVYVAFRAKNPFSVLFTLLYFLFVQVGLVFMFADMETVVSLFQSFDFSTIGKAEVARAAIIIAAGTAVASFFAAAVPVKTDRMSQSYEKSIDAISLSLIALGSLLTILYIVVVFTLIHDYVRASGMVPHSLILRREVSQNYVLILVVFNLMPMCVLYMLLHAYTARRIAYFLLFSGLYLLAAVALFLTFQKRPLILFMGMISSVAVALYWREKIKSIRNAFAFRHALVIGCILAVPVVTLGGMYFLEQTFRNGMWITAPTSAAGQRAQTTSSEPPAISNEQQKAVARAVKRDPPIRRAGSTRERIVKAVESLVSRAFGRMAISTAMFIDYYPEGHPFYGLANIGLLAEVTGQPLYNPGRDLFDRFSASETVVSGNISSPAIIDFYGQFGWPGVLVGSALIGVGLVALHWLLARERGDFASYVFLLAAGELCVFYLSQANVFRSALGYGGVIFLGCWLIFFGRYSLAPLFKRHQTD